MDTVLASIKTNKISTRLATWENLVFDKGYLLPTSRKIIQIDRIHHLAGVFTNRKWTLSGLTNQAPRYYNLPWASSQNTRHKFSYSYYTLILISLFLLKRTFLIHFNPFFINLYNFIRYCCLFLYVGIIWEQSWVTYNPKCSILPIWPSTSECQIGIIEGWGLYDQNFAPI